jgi:PIN domain nuclease of toxin-antitoxin system
MPEKLPAIVVEKIEDPANQIFVSAVTVWEMAIKSNIGKLPLPSAPDIWVRARLTEHSFDLLPIRNEHVFRTFGLPLHHRDPFDRLLVAQCISENMPLISSDTRMQLYPIEVIW